MNSRDKILERIKNNKPSAVARPMLPSVSSSEEEVLRFKNSLQAIGGQVIELTDLSLLKETIVQRFPVHSKIVSSIFSNEIEIDSTTDKKTVESIDVAVLQASFAVAENGAVWLSEKEMLHRALPFITQHLVVVVSHASIVSSMHQAYEKISEVPAYGVFIAGPSKTADIEQSLVIGAHGARSMTVVLY